MGESRRVLMMKKTYATNSGDGQMAYENVSLRCRNCRFWWPLKDDKPDTHLREHASRELAAFKLPRKFHLAATLPRNAAGKVLRSEVRGWFLGEVAQKNRA